MAAASVMGRAAKLLIWVRLSLVASCTASTMGDRLTWPEQPTGLNEQAGWLNAVVPRPYSKQH